MLWSKLRDRQVGGLKFRRQHPVGPFVADFYCAEAKLIVEIDGSMHDRHHDQRRDAWMTSEGYETIRFTASRVSTDLRGVLDAILTHARQRIDEHNS